MSTLDSATPPYYTIFAPTNEAFANAGFTDSTIYKDSASYLKRLLSYNMIIRTDKAWATSDFPQGVNVPVESGSPGDYLYITTDSAGVFINGTLIGQSNVIAKNGYLNGIQNVLIPPVGSLYQTLLADTNYSVLVFALNYVSNGMGAAGLDSLLSRADTARTLFAPTNNAFRAYFGDTTTVSFANYGVDSTLRLLNRHIINGRYFTSDFPYSASFPTLLTGDSVSFSPYNVNVIVQKDSITTSTIIAPNILSTNGVIHKISSVLIP